MAVRSKNGVRQGLPRRIGVRLFGGQGLLQVKCQQSFFLNFSGLRPCASSSGSHIASSWGSAAPSLSDLFDRSWIDNSGDEELEYELVALDEKPRRR